MVARRMAEERLFAVSTSNSSQSVQKSCCVMDTSSSMIRIFGFIFFTPPRQPEFGKATASEHRRQPRGRRICCRASNSDALLYRNACATAVLAEKERSRRNRRAECAQEWTGRKGLVCTFVDRDWLETTGWRPETC